MADTSLYARLRRLFSTNVIVRNVGGKKLKVADTEQIQAMTKSHLVDRYSKLHSGLDLVNSGYSTYAQLQAARLGLFKDYESMDSDSIIASALDIYADECTMKNPYGEVLNIVTDNNNIKEILHNLFYDILNIEFNLWPWTRNMVKYGDFFLGLEIAEGKGIVNVTPHSVYNTERLERTDPSNPNSVKFKITEDPNGKEEYENFEVAHFRLLADTNWLPYGKSMIENGRRLWKQLSLMEDAMLIHRIMRAPEKRMFKMDIGNIPPTEV